MKHETRNTTAVLKFCNRCNKRTMHSVSDRRVGHCLEHAPEGLSKTQEQRRKKSENENSGLKFDF
jgi:ribosomal protein L44E